MNEPVVFKGFACHCGAEKKEKMEALRAEVCAALKCEPTELVSEVVYNLNWSLGVNITGIPCDMWSAILSEHRRHVTDEEWDALPEDASDADEWVLVASARIQCDSIVDGFALTWKTWKEWSEAKK